MKKAIAELFDIAVNDVPDIMDLRGLEAPEPMEKILMASVQLAPGDRFLARLPHFPTPLFPHLESRGLEWQVHEEDDGCALVLIRRKS